MAFPGAQIGAAKSIPQSIFSGGAGASPLGSVLSTGSKLLSGLSGLPSLDFSSSASSAADSNAVAGAGSFAVAFDQGTVRDVASNPDISRGAGASAAATNAGTPAGQGGLALPTLGGGDGLIGWLLVGAVGLGVIVLAVKKK